MLSQAAPLFFCSLLNMYDLRFKDFENLAKISSYISMIVLISVISALLLIFGKVCLFTRNLNREQVTNFKINFSVLTESLKENRVVNLAVSYSDYRFLDETKEGRYNLALFCYRISAKITKNKHWRLTFLMSKIRKK
jgi:hypothetical protein